MTRQGDPKSAFLSACLLGVVWAVVGSALAGEVYTWVDANGVTHYSEIPPPGAGGGAVGRVDIPQGPSDAPPGPGADDAGYRGMLDVARELEASRLAREDERLRQENVRLRQQLQERASQLDYGGEPDARYGYPVPYYYPYYYARPPHRPPPFSPDGGHRARPGHPHDLPETGDPTVNRWLRGNRVGNATGRYGAPAQSRSAAPALRMR
jgi:hypothetical protein